MKINRPKSSTPDQGLDTWLTPPLLLRALGPFDTDPCCPAFMPWKTAARMVQLPSNGLQEEWSGRVWLNPPYSDPSAWIVRMGRHGSGIALLPSKGLDSQWGQLAIGSADAVLFKAGRIKFYDGAGNESDHGWSPMMFCAWGADNVQTLRHLMSTGALSGQLMARAV